MLDRQTIKTLYLIPEVDLQKAKELPFTDEPELQPDESKFGNRETCQAAFRATQIAFQAI